MRTQAISEEEGRAQQSCEEFYNRITNGYKVTAGPALSHEDQIADQWNVVIEFDPSPAVRTTGGGMDDGFPLWDSMDTNIEKASQHEAK